MAFCFAVINSVAAITLKAINDARGEFLRDHIFSISYRRYVDDAFLLFSSELHVTKFLNYMNSKHRNIKFIYLFVNHYFSSNTTFSTYTNSNRLDNYKNPVAF